MKPSQLAKALHALFAADFKLSAMIWGPPGVGKSSVVQQVGQALGLPVIDLRLSQLAPTDLRGLPVADRETRSATWFAPSFLPRSGRGILFLDEINQAPPAMQGMAQQLILNRQVGDYQLPEGWLVVAAGNRKEDRAAVAEMPAPLANRFVHFEVAPDLADFTAYAAAHAINERIVAFLNFRPILLHRFDALRPTWPSPRSWEAASKLLQIGLGVEFAVGEGAGHEFSAYCQVYQRLPDIAGILAAKANPAFPKEPSECYATVLALALRLQDEHQALHALNWLTQRADAEWLMYWGSSALPILRKKGRMGQFTVLGQKNLKIQEMIERYAQLLHT
jgi:hypothetical protein